MNNVYLLLGSNLAGPALQLDLAKEYIAAAIGSIVQQSSIYQTAAWGKTDQPDFLNQVLVVQTMLTPEKILDQIFTIEKKMGRIRTEKNAPRIIDIDILFYNNEIIETKHLSVPHPSLQNRRFVLVPLDELAPDLIHPVSNKTIHALLMECTDELVVKRF